MLNRFVGALLVLGALGACGSGGDDSAPTSAPLNTGFAKTWNGTATMALTGGSSFSYASQIVIAVAGNDATFAKVCPDGSGTGTAHGSGDSASWSGTLVCPAIPFNGCSAVTFSYTQATVTLGSAGATLTLIATGSGSGCGTAYPMTVTFTSP